MTDPGRTGAVHLYSVFGGALASELELPELLRCSPERTPDWTFVVGSSESTRSGAVLLAEESLGGGVTVRLNRISDGVRFEYSDTGVFEITDGGRKVVWHPAPNANERFARVDLLGRVLAAALQMSGAHCLHASAVAVGDRGIGFIGEKGLGKSTLAAALSREGARLVTDDTLVVRTLTPPVCVPGVQSLRLREGTARHFGRTLGRHSVDESNGRTIKTPARKFRITRAVELDALYILAPALPDSEAPVRRERVDAVSAALALVVHSKLGLLQGAEHAAASLEHAARLADRIPIYILYVARDLDRIQTVARALIDWHMEPSDP